VAPNSVSPASAIFPAGEDDKRSSFVYVGRLEPSKKVDLLVRAFADMDDSSVTLNIVGEGSQRDHLEELARALGANVRFWGQIIDLEELRSVYSTAIAAVSPGYVGLGLTQSLGFGVPMIVSRNEPHAPEIELSALKGSVVFFETGSVESLRDALAGSPRWVSWDERGNLCAQLRRAYSAEAMAEGLLAAFENRPQQLGGSGWPI
jgi:glycosyltransferase involved in cell wall biosynthesis